MFKGLVAVGCVVALLSVTPVALGEIATSGTLAANDGKHIYDWELEIMIGTLIGDQAGVDYESMVLAFTECYGGDKFDDFAGYGNTALLSGSNPGRTTIYGGYHRALAGALAPGITSDAAHAAGVAGAAVGDSPMKAGANVTLGGSGSTHVLVWAGDPNAQDQADINDIHGNFNGQPNTTVTVLSGDGTGANVDGAADFANLVDAIDNIGAQMNANEQFVLFVTDHGDLDQGDVGYVCDPGYSYTMLDMPAYDDMMLDQSNQPQLSIFTGYPIDFKETVDVLVNNVSLSHGSGAVHPLDYDNDSIVDVYEIIYELDEETLVATGNWIEFDNTGATMEFDVWLESGAIARTPEPTTLALLALGALVGCCRRRA